MGQWAVSRVGKNDSHVAFCGRGRERALVRGLLAPYGGTVLELTH